MSCGPSLGRSYPSPSGRLATLGDEGFRLFFPLSALYLALFPLMWVIAWGFDLPLATQVPPSLWHGHEMLVGGFGAALIGFLTTAVPEWTDTELPRGAVLWKLAALWATGRVVGFLGWDTLGALGALVDLTWLLALLVFLLRVSWKKRTDKLLAFAFWIVVLTGCVGFTRWQFYWGDTLRASQGLNLVGFAYLGLLGLALARITVPVTNLVLDPSERTSPFRPHPGRLHLAPGLVLVAMIGQMLELSPAVCAYLTLAVGCAFIDRVAEAFIGREAFRSEILLLSGSSALAGLGLLLLAFAELGAPWSAVGGLHIAFMGGLGLAVFAVLCIAGLLHTNRPLELSVTLKLGGMALIASIVLRGAPDFGFALPDQSHAVASLLWASAFLIWTVANWSALSRVDEPGEYNERTQQPVATAWNQAAE